MRSAAGPLLAAALLCGCATLEAPQAGARWTAGRMSVRIEASALQSAQSMSAGFELRGSGVSGELRLNSPLGTRLATARWSAGDAILITTGGERHFDNLDALSRETLGENLPLAALPDWLAGRPWNGAAHQLRETGFEQLGWQVQLARKSEGWIEARRPAAPEVMVRVRLDEAQP
jgi:outer membrane lipoprotein LolB